MPFHKTLPHRCRCPGISPARMRSSLIGHLDMSLPTSLNNVRTFEFNPDLRTANFRSLGIPSLPTDRINAKFLASMAPHHGYPASQRAVDTYGFLGSVTHP